MQVRDFAKFSNSGKQRLVQMDGLLLLEFEKSRLYRMYDFFVEILQDPNEKEVRINCITNSEIIQNYFESIPLHRLYGD